MLPERKKKSSLPGVCSMGQPVPGAVARLPAGRFLLGVRSLGFRTSTGEVSPAEGSRVAISLSTAATELGQVVPVRTKQASPRPTSATCGTPANPRDRPTFPSTEVGNG